MIEVITDFKGCGRIVPYFELLSWCTPGRIEGSQGKPEP
jgi:hypothetical protein